MGLKAMVTVDLNKNVSSSQRATFNEKMNEKEWLKLESLTTTWKASFQDTATTTGVVKTTKSDVASAASSAEITDYDAAVMVGNDSPTIF